MKNKFLFGIKVFISVGLLAYLFSKINVDQILYRFSEINLLLLCVVVPIFFFQYVLSSLKWKFILQADNIHVPYSYLLGNYLIGGFISLFLPTSFGGDIYRVYSLKKYDGDMVKNTSSVLFDRISGLFALVSISVISYIFFYGKIINFRLFALFVTLSLSFWFLSTDKTVAFLSGLKVKIPRIFIDILQSFSIYKKSKETFFKALFLSFFFHHNVVWIVKIYCVSLNVDIGIKYLFMIVPLIYLTEVLPISVNGLGVRDSAFVFFFLQIGKTNEEALSVSLLLIMMRYLFAILFGGSLFLRTLFNYRYDKKENKIKT